MENSQSAIELEGSREKKYKNTRSHWLSSQANNKASTRDIETAVGISSKQDSLSIEGMEE
jgi:hypothetical protein